jgi:hypothetical protein
MISKQEFNMSMFDSLINAIDQKVGQNQDTVVPFEQWVLDAKIVLDGKLFSYKKHEYLYEPYKDTHPFQVEIKATQLGLTSKAMLKCFYLARYGGEKIKGIGYYFPSRTDVTDLSKARLSPLIEDNPDTIGSWMRDVDAANVKRIWNTSLYLRGMKSRVGMKSAPMDAVIFDELDEAPQNSVDMILERLAHSESGEILFLSNPTLPEYGIDLLFSSTDQQYFLLKCPACNEYTDMVGTFPDCLHTLKGGRVIRACIKCGKELDPAKGEWVAKRPSITERRGRQFSQLYAQSKMTDPTLILEKFHSTKNLTDFYNLKIGIAYVDAQNRLTKQEVFACCGNSGMLSESDTACFMGVDQGKHLHVVIGRKRVTGPPEVIYIGIHKGNNTSDVTDESGWLELDALMKRFKVGRCVVDAMPNKKNARSFADRFRGRVYLNFYNPNQKGSYKWNEREMIVQCDRTESLDFSHSALSNMEVSLPRQSDMIDVFAKQCTNVAKRLITNEDTGSSHYEYITVGDREDHFRHSFSYMLMCIQDSPDLMFTELL